MKRVSFTSLVILVAMCYSSTAIAQNFKSLNKSPMDMASYPSSYKVSDKLVRVAYSRPQLKDRSLEKLAPNDKIWRTGANEATEITFYTPMILGETEIQPGTYSLFTIPSKGSWTVIVNKASNNWGTSGYDEKMDVARYKAPATSGNKNVEAFSIIFSESKTGIDMFMGWGDVVVTVPFTKAK